MAEGPPCSPLFPLLLQAVALACCEPRMSSVLLGCSSLLPPAAAVLLRAWLAALWAGSPSLCLALAQLDQSKHLSKTLGDPGSG